MASLSVLCRMACLGLCTASLASLSACSLNATPSAQQQAFAHQIQLACCNLAPVLGYYYPLATTKFALQSAEPESQEAQALFALCAESLSPQPITAASANASAQLLADTAFSNQSQPQNKTNTTVLLNSSTKQTADKKAQSAAYDTSYSTANTAENYYPNSNTTSYKQEPPLNPCETALQLSGAQVCTLEHCADAVPLESYISWDEQQSFILVEFKTADLTLQRLYTKQHNTFIPAGPVSVNTKLPLSMPVSLTNSQQLTLSDFQTSSLSTVQPFSQTTSQNVFQATSQSSTQNVEVKDNSQQSNFAHAKLATHTSSAEPRSNVVYSKPHSASHPINATQDSQTLLSLNRSSNKFTTNPQTSSLSSAAKANPRNPVVAATSASGQNPTSTANLNSQAAALSHSKLSEKSSLNSPAANYQPSPSASDSGTAGSTATSPLTPAQESKQHQVQIDLNLLQTAQAITNSASNVASKPSSNITSNAVDNTILNTVANTTSNEVAKTTPSATFNATSNAESNFDLLPELNQRIASFKQLNAAATKANHAQIKEPHSALSQNALSSEQAKFSYALTGFKTLNGEPYTTSTNQPNTLYPTLENMQPLATIHADAQSPAKVFSLASNTASGSSNSLQSPNSLQCNNSETNTKSLTNTNYLATNNYLANNSSLTSTNALPNSTLQQDANSWLSPRLQAPTQNLEQTMSHTHTQNTQPSLSTVPPTAKTSQQPQSQYTSYHSAPLPLKLQVQPITVVTPQTPQSPSPAYWPDFLSSLLSQSSSNVGRQP